MTGRYPSHNGIGPDVIRPNRPYGLPADEVTLAQKFQEAGYKTHLVGKWHLGLCDERMTPTFRGFESFMGYLLGAEDYWNHTRAYEGLDGLDLRRTKSFDAQGVLPPPARTYNGTYSTFVFA